MEKNRTLCVVPNNISIITPWCLLILSLIFRGVNYAINTILLNRTCQNIQTLPQVMKFMIELLQYFQILKNAHFQYWPLIQKLHVVKDLWPLSSKIAELNEEVPHLVSEEDFHQAILRFCQLKLLKELGLEVPCISCKV